jgi:uncharacterized protein (TIGR00251 family)
MIEGLALRDTEGGVLLPLLVVPRARHHAVQGVVGGRLKLRVAAPPSGGAANAACLELVAELLSVRRSAVELVRGAATRQKLVRIAGLSAAEAAGRLSSSRWHVHTSARTSNGR